MLDINILGNTSNYSGIQKDVYYGLLGIFCVNSWYEYVCVFTIGG